MLDKDRIPAAYRPFALALLDKPDAPAELFRLLMTLAPRAGSAATVEFADWLAAAWPDHPIVRAGAAKIRTSRVPNYHLSMIADSPRNAAYADGIAATIEPGMTVLEIGAGSGFLSMLAARAGAGRVYAVEQNPVMLGIARDNIAKNGLEDRIELIEGLSTDGAVRARIPKDCDALIHELFGATLLDEGALSYVTDARETFLRSDGLVLPDRAMLYGHLEGGDLRKRPPHTDVNGLDLSALDRLHANQRMLSKADRDLVEPLSDPFTIAEFDMTSIQQAGKAHAISDVGVTRSGTCHGVVQWIGFSFPNGASYSNPPGAPSHWAPVFHEAVEPVPVREGETRSLAVDRVGWCIACTLA